MSPPGLTRHSVLWISVETVGNALLLIGTMLLMARLVGPSEFAIAALLIGAVQLVNIYVEWFFHDALIQKPEIGDAVFDSAFWASMLVALAMLAVAALGVMLVTGEHARSAALLFCAALALPFNAALGVMNARLRRDFRHDRVAHGSIFGRVIGAGVGLAVAAGGGGAWGLVTQFTVAAAANTLLVNARMRYRPRLVLSLPALRPLVRFALPNACMQTLVGARLQGFTLLVAALMGLSAAGFVNMAFRLVTTPQIILGAQLMNVSFPVLSRQQADAAALADAFRSVTKFVTIVALPMFVGLALTAEDIVPLALGPGWEPSIPLVQILSLGASVVFLRLSGSFVVRALGHVRLSFYNAALQLTLTLGGLLLLRPTEPVHAVLLWVLPTATALLVTMPILSRVAGIKPGIVVSAIFPPLVATLGMAGAALLAVAHLPLDSVLQDLLVKVGVGGLVYTVVLLGLDREARGFAFRLVRGPPQPG